MKKEILLTPGPSQVPPAVAEVAARPIIHHRSKDFRPVLKRIFENLKPVFGTEKDVYVLSSSGTGAMEACVVNTLSAGDTVIVGVTGKFGERYSQICKAYGVNVIEIVREWGDIVTANDVEKALSEHPDAKAVFITHSETSTGVMHRLDEIGAVTKNTNALLIVDTVSALGGLEMRMDKWGVDVVAAGSQKALMLAPGLAFIAFSDKAMEAAKKSTLPKFYFDISKYKKTYDKSGETPFTSAVTLCLSLDVSLQMILDEGIENVYARHRLMSKACKAGVAALGLEFFTKYGSDVETVFTVPEGVDGLKIVEVMRDRYGVRVSGGQDPYKGKIVRIAHMGYVTSHDVILALSALEMTLDNLGFLKTKGAAVAAAEEVLRDEA